MRSSILAALCLATALSGCKTLTQNDNAEPTYSSEAEVNLKNGNDAFDQKLFNEAEKYFEYVKVKYPYLELAKTAELRLADTDFERDKFEEARDKYLAFVKIHPTHPKVDYAAYRAALSHFKQIPSDFFLLPPSYEKEQTEVKAALQSMNDFVRQFPKSGYVADAQKLIADCKRRLAEHELYVADFYRKREKWGAVVTRLKTVEDQFSGIGYDDRALLGLYEAYSKLHDMERAKEALKKLVATQPGTPAAAKAQKLLGS